MLTLLLLTMQSMSIVPAVPKKSPPVASKSQQNQDTGSDITASFQFPVAPDDESSSSGASDKSPTPPQQPKHVPDLSRQPTSSALKKSPSSSSEGNNTLGTPKKKKAPAFKERCILCDIAHHNL